MEYLKIVKVFGFISHNSPLVGLYLVYNFNYFYLLYLKGTYVNISENILAHDQDTGINTTLKYLLDSNPGKLLR